MIVCLKATRLIEETKVRECKIKSEKEKIKMKRNEDSLVFKRQKPGNHPPGETLIAQTVSLPVLCPPLAYWRGGK